MGNATDNVMNFKRMFAYIEDNIGLNPDVSTLAQQMGMSVYEFRRVFSFLVGMPVGEYLRKRKLSRAAFDLMEGEAVSDVAARYGYDAPSSFSRAFKEFHGFAPQNIDQQKIRMLTRADVDVSLNIGVEIPYSVMQDTAFTVSGYLGESDATDTECCENVWSGFYEPQNEAIHTACGDEIYAVYYNAPDSVTCLIGARDAAVEGTERRCLPATKWACFEMTGADDATVNAFYSDVLLRWFNSSHYERDDRLPNVEVYPADMEADDFKWEIRIPLKNKEA